MRPRIGVYEYDVDLHSVLLELYCYVSNRMLMHHLVTEPIYSLQKQAENPDSNPYILRERLRKWKEYLHDQVGVWLPLPSWDELIANEFSEQCVLCGEWMDCSCTSGSEWEIYGDDVDIAFDIVQRLHTPLLMSDDMSAVVDKMLETNPEMRDLIIVASDLNAIYVVRSPQVESCSECVPPMTGFHAFEYLADGQSKGETPTYVLENDVIEAFAELRNIGEE